MVIMVHSTLSCPAFQDYTPVTTMLEFGEDRTSNTVRVPIINDEIRELDELFVVSLRLIQNEEEEDVTPVVLEPQFAAVQIVDDDGELNNRRVTVSCVHSYPSFPTWKSHNFVWQPCTTLKLKVQIHLIWRQSTKFDVLWPFHDV